MTLRGVRALRLPRPTLADRGLITLVAVLCALVTVGTAGASAWLRVTADDMASQVFEDAAYPARQLQVFYSEVRDRTVPEDAPVTIARSLPPSLDTILREPRHAVTLAESVPHELSSTTTDRPAFLSVVGFPDTRDLIDIVAGRFPRSGTRQELLPRAVAAAHRGPRRTYVVEVALERRTAEALHLAVGGYLSLTPRSYRRPADEAPVLRVSGIYEPSSAYPSPLDDVDNARRPAISTLPEFTMVRAAAVAADDTTVLGAPWAVYPEVRWTFDADGTPTAAEAAAVVPTARHLAVQAWPRVLDSGASSAGTGIGDLAATFVAERDSSDTLAALILAVLAAAALSVLLAAASVLEIRRREVSDVLRARGAPLSHLALIRATEATLVTAPGVLATALLVAATPMRTHDLLPAAVAAATCVALLTVAQVAPSGPLPERLRLAVRDAFQIVAVALAVGMSAVLVWRQHLDARDPLLLALPGLVGLALTVLALRGVRTLTAAARRLAGRSRRLSPLVGASQSGTAAQHVLLPVLGVVLAATCALLSTSVEDSVRRDAGLAAWRAVGADVQISQGYLDESLTRRIGDLPGVTGLVGVHTANGMLDTRIGSRQVSVLALDTEALARVRDDAPDPVDLRLSGREPLEIVVSRDVDVEGGSTTLDYAQTSVPVRVVEHVDGIPGLTGTGPFVVVEERPFRAAVDRQQASYERLLVAGDPDPDALRAMVHETAPQARVRTRAGAEQEILAGTVTGRTLLVARAAAGASLLLGLVAAGFAVATGRPLRRRSLAVLHALGVDRRQARWVNAWELVPAMVGAGLAACLGALLLTTTAGRGVDLAVLTGSADAPAFGLDPASWLVSAAAFAALVVAVAVASARLGGDEHIPDEEAR